MEIFEDCDEECDWEPNRVWDERTRTARKEHECEECGEAIKPGTKYIYVTYLDYEATKWRDYKVCIPCQQISRDYGCCCAIGELRNHLKEVLGFDYVTGEEVF
jgi:hypothetical protein